MAEKKTTRKTAAEPKKTTTRKTVAAKKVVATPLTSENAGYRAGDVYNALHDGAQAMTAEEIAKAVGITVEEVLLGIGWLLKEGKLASVEDNKITLA